MSSPSNCSKTSPSCISSHGIFSRFSRFFTAALFLVQMASCSHEASFNNRRARVYEAWDVINQPTRFGRQFETRFDSLPKSGQLSRIPWSDYYWATQRAGIAYRWLNPAAQPFRYEPPSRQTLASMNSDEIAKLSPAEKLDIFMGRFDYPTVFSERKRTYPGAAAWEGLCHGWAPASLVFAEPGTVTLEGAANIKVPFGSSDIKALLGWYMALHNSVGAIGLGGRCNFGGSLGMNTAACRDTNAGAFHIVLSNMLGRFREGFIMDIARAAEVWNQPVYGFSSREVSRQAPSPGAAPGTRQEVIVESRINYSIEIEPQWNPHGQLLESPSVSSVVYRYRLELDAQGAIRGGEWLQDTRPDFIWLQERDSFPGLYKSIEKIYQSSRL